MVGLPSRIIKKFGVTKKAWQVFRGEKSASRSVKRARRSSRKRTASIVKSSSGGKYMKVGKNNMMLSGAASFGYGFVRGKAVQAASPYLSKVPGGKYADNVAFGILAYLAARKGKGMMRTVGKVVLNCEAFDAGRKAASNSSLATTSSASGALF
jgi:hypothetical protein